MVLEVSSLVSECHSGAYGISVTQQCSASFVRLACGFTLLSFWWSPIDSFVQFCEATVAILLQCHPVCLSSVLLQTPRTRTSPVYSMDTTSTPYSHTLLLSTAPSDPICFTCAGALCDSGWRMPRAECWRVSAEPHSQHVVTHSAHTRGMSRV